MRTVRRKKQIQKTQRHKKTRHQRQRGGSTPTANCSPKPIGDRKSGESKSCYSMNDLVRLKDAWNKRNPTNLIHSKTQTELVDELTNKLHTLSVRHVQVASP